MQEVAAAVPNGKTSKDNQLAHATLDSLTADYNIGVKPHVVAPLKRALARVAPSLELDAERGPWPTWPAKSKRRSDLIRVSIRITDVKQIQLIRTTLMWANLDDNVNLGDVFYHHVLTDPADGDSIIKLHEARSED